MKKVRLKIPYKPLPTHRKFHEDPRRVKLLRGGVGAGKTTAGAAEAIRLAILNPGYDGMIVAPTWPVLLRTTLRKFQSLVPKELVAEERKRERYIALINGTRVYYGSADRPDTLEGADLAWAWADELRYWKEESWRILLARVRSPGAPKQSIVCTSTPRKNWMFDEFANREDRLDLQVATVANTYLPQEYLDTLKRSYSEDLWRQDVEGDWVDMGGAAFPEFSVAKHVQEGLAEAIEGELILGFDPGLRKSAGVLIDWRKYCRTHNAERCGHIVREFLYDETPTFEVVQKLSVELKRAGLWPDLVVLDPASNARSIQTGIPDLQLFKRAGFNATRPTRAVQRDILAGVQQLRAAMRPVHGPARFFIDASIKPAASVTRHRGLVNALLRIEADDEGRPDKDGHYEHIIDATRYAWIYMDPPVETTVFLS